MLLFVEWSEESSSARQKGNVSRHSWSRRYQVRTGVVLAAFLSLDTESTQRESFVMSHFGHGSKLHAYFLHFDERGDTTGGYAYWRLPGV